MSEIKHPDMVKTLKKPGNDIIATLTPEKADAWHMASCIPGEAAELHDACLNNDKENALEELGDIQFYVEGLRQACSIDRNETLTSKIIDVSVDQIPGLAGLVFDAVKKWVIYNKSFDREAIVKALTQFELGLAAASIKFDLTYEQSLTHNIGKLGERYKGFKYSDKAAQDRADKQVAIQNVEAANSAKVFRVQDDHTNLDAVASEGSKIAFPTKQA
jgi:NTP pyrophosphatase (non-canonical NTP hydrolase)